MESSARDLNPSRAKRCKGEKCRRKLYNVSLFIVGKKHLRKNYYLQGSSSPPFLFIILSNGKRGVSQGISTHLILEWLKWRWKVRDGFSYMKTQLLTIIGHALVTGEEGLENYEEAHKPLPILPSLSNRDNQRGWRSIPMMHRLNPLARMRRRKPSYERKDKLKWNPWDRKRARLWAQPMNPFFNFFP